MFNLPKLPPVINMWAHVSRVLLDWFGSRNVFKIVCLKNFCDKKTLKHFSEIINLTCCLVLVVFLTYTYAFNF